MVAMGGGMYMMMGNGPSSEVLEANKTRGAEMLMQAIKDNEGC